MQRTPLPKAQPGTVETITIADHNFGRESSTLAAARERARDLASEPHEAEEDRSHPIVARTLSKLRKAKPSDLGVVGADGPGVIGCQVAPASIDRLANILRLVARAAALQGFALVATDGAAHFKSETESVGFSVTELVRRERHVLTDAERAKEEAWQRKRDRAVRANSWNDIFNDRPRFPEWDHHPTGQLSFEFEQVYLFRRTSPRRSFRDAKIQRLENMASDIAVGLAVLAAAKTEERLRREAQQRDIEAERHRRELAARAKHIEDRRAAGLVAILDELDELDRLRRLMAMLAAKPDESAGARVSTFLVWAKEHLAQRQARLTAQAIEERFEADQLFGDTDDHGFIPHRWY